MKKTIALLTLLSVAGLSYESGHLRNGTVQADETPKWAKIGTPLKVFDHEDVGYASTEGFWQSTSSTKDKQLVYPIAVKITCTRASMTCDESEASVVILGALSADLTEFDISSWTKDGIVADGPEGNCAIGHRLSLDFNSNSVTVTDYPKRVLDGDCMPFQDANSYALHGGYLMLRPPPTWDPLAKPEGK
jgi:hypothetical protein